jgi:hypothetical protein
MCGFFMGIATAGAMLGVLLNCGPAVSSLSGPSVSIIDPIAAAPVR